MDHELFVQGIESPLEKQFKVKFEFESKLYEDNTGTTLTCTLGELKDKFLDIVGLEFEEAKFLKQDIYMLIESVNTRVFDDIIPLYQFFDYGSNLTMDEVPTELNVKVHLDRAVNTLTKFDLSDGSSAFLGKKSYDIVEKLSTNNEILNTDSNGHLFIDQMDTSSVKYRISVTKQNGEIIEVELSSQQCIIVDDGDSSSDPYILLSNSGRRALDEVAHISVPEIVVDPTSNNRLHQAFYGVGGNINHFNNGNRNNDNNNNNNNIFLGNNGGAFINGRNEQVRLPIVPLLLSAYRLVRHAFTSRFLIRLGTLAWMIFKYVFLLVFFYEDAITWGHTFAALYIVFILTRQEVVEQIYEIINNDLPDEAQRRARSVVGFWEKCYKKFTGAIESVEKTIVMLGIGNNRNNLTISYDNDDNNDNNDNDDNDKRKFFDGVKLFPFKYESQLLNTILIIFQDLVLLIVTALPTTFLQFTYQLQIKKDEIERIKRKKSELEEAETQPEALEEAETQPEPEDVDI